MNILSSVSLNLYLIFEVLGFISFAVILGREIYQKNKIRILEIFSCLVFGMILEIGNTYLSHAYYYYSEFFIQIFNVPLAIGMGWAVIIYCTMLLSDQYNIPWNLRPFMDALTAVILDLALDPIAIRLNFWHWAIPLNREWFGVPYENFLGWFLVVLSFSFIIRYLRTLNLERLLSRVLWVASPILAYLGLIIGLALFSLVAILPYKLSNWNTLLVFNYHPDSILYNPIVQVWKLIFLVIILVELVNVVAWSIAKYRKNIISHFDILSFSVLSSLHLFFLISLFISGIYKEEPILIFLSMGMFVAHLLMHFILYLFNPKVIYIFKEVKKTIEKEEGELEKIIDKSLK